MVDELVELCDQFDAQDQALRSRIVELMSFAEHQVAARVEISFETQRLAGENVGLHARVAELETQLRRTEEALDAVHATRVFRATLHARRLYGRLRGRTVTR